MKNPLNKRLLRELTGDWKKYLALFLLMVLMIGACSAMFVANDSMEGELADAYTKYNIEDGHFELKDKATDKLTEYYEAEGIKVYEQFYKDFDEYVGADDEKDADIRVFVIRDEVNGICVMEGSLPETDEEIAIDRMHADNLGIRVGDHIRLNDETFTVSGLIALSDYSTLYKKPSDTMFDALTFNIGVVTKSTFDRLDARPIYQYAYKYNVAPEDTAAQKDRSEALAEQLAVLAATGCMFDDKDEAKAFDDKIDSMTDELEKIGEEADKLKDRQAELEAEGKALEAEGDALQAEADALEEEGAALQSKQADLMSKLGPVLAATGMTGTTASDGEPDLEAFEALIPYLPEAYQADVKSLIDQAKELKARGEELQSRGDELQIKGDALQAKADELAADADEFKPTADRAEEMIDELEGYQDDWDSREEDRNELTGFVPEYINQAIHFAPTDMGSDKAMIQVLMIVLIIVLAFIFAITTNNTITTEASAIGTLRASGYTRGEMLKHYIAVPVAVTVIAAAVGNILGYTCLKNVVVFMYYNSYSLPTYTTRWNADAFVRTTVLPIVIVFIINLIVIVYKLRLSPLKFLRHDLSNSRRKRAVRLPDWKFMTRFRTRVFIQNISGYLVLFLGIFFVDVLLGFSIGLPGTLHDYQDHALDYMLVDYQYVLTSTEDKDGNEIKTTEPMAEKYSVNTLEAIIPPHIGEKVTVYGIAPDSMYFDLPKDIKDGEIYVTEGFADKFLLESGQTLTLKEEYSEKTYDFKIAGSFKFSGTIGIVMSQRYFNDVFDLDEDSFTGYLSDKEITDIDDEYILTTITAEDVTKIANQLDHSMGSAMSYVSIVSTIIAMMLMYLLTKIIIEHNATSISMVKVLGYENKEVNSLYIRITTIVVIISAIIGSLLSKIVLVEMWKSVMAELNGWFEFVMKPMDFVKIIALTILAYLVVMIFDMRRIRRIPLTEALKNVE